MGGGGSGCGQRSSTVAVWRGNKGSVCKPFCFLLLLQTSQSHADLHSGPRNLRRLWAPALVTPSELGVHWQRRSDCSGCPYTYVPPHPSGAGHILFSLACASNQRHVHGAQNGCLPVCGLYTQAFASTISLLALLAVSKGTHYCLCFTVEEIKD